MEIVSFAQYGYEGETIKVEADLRRGIPAIDIVGLADGAVREARERMRVAIRNSGLEFPRDRILINLSPADLKKEGTAFDLPIALAVLAAENDLLARAAGKQVMVLGELELSGKVRAVRGVLSAVSHGLHAGIRDFIVPEGNRPEALIPGAARVIGAETLADAASGLIGLVSDETGDTGITGETGAASRTNDARQAFRPDVFSLSPVPGYEDIRGQSRLVRALEIAAAGGHHLIAFGPPGCGKTLAISRFPAILPDLDGGTAETLTRIHSIAGILSPADGAKSALITRPPFRAPHQSASGEGIIGGGRRCGPGEISLAHGGALFLDEAALFRAGVLQALRAPLETGTVTVSRAGRSSTFPARFQLLMATNPCPCGNYGSSGKFCSCTPDMIEKYWRRLAAPLLDRVDLRVPVEMPDPEEFASEERFSTEELRKEIGRARNMQWERNAVRGGKDIATGWLNAQLAPAEIPEVCALSGRTERLFARCMGDARFSGRGGHGILKVARTIADLEGAEDIGEDHLLEAAQFRRWNDGVPDFLR